jgi:geranylgeranyl pyrophosphate synthase
MMPITEMDLERLVIQGVVDRRRQDAAHVFARRVMPEVDAAIADSVAGLGRGLGDVEAVIARAVGVQGPRGRRWRPLLGLAAAVAAGGRMEDAIPLVVAVELTHTASLVLDDLPCMDDTSLRRGASSTHREIGTAGAILVTIGLLGRAAELIATVPGHAAELGGRWGRTIGLAGMSGGQAIDLSTTRPPKGASRRLHRQKTVSLSVLAVEGSARAAGASDECCSALRRYATDLGWAYQLADDAVDREQDDVAGRPAGGHSPRAQSRRLMARAEWRLRQAEVLHPDGLDLLLQLGRSVVPPGGAADDPSAPTPREREDAC